MDQSRFQEIQLELEQLLVAGTVLLVTFSAAGAALIDVPGFAEKIKTIVKVLLTGMHLPWVLSNPIHTVSGSFIMTPLNNQFQPHSGYGLEYMVEVLGAY